MVLLFILLVLSVIIVSGIVSGSEASILSISYARTKELVTNSIKGSKERLRAENLLKIKEDLQKYITTIVVLNNIVNIIGSIYIGILASQIFGTVYVGIVSAALTFLIIMFSEIIPNVYGDKYCKVIAPRISGFLIILTKIFYPINVILNRLTRIFVKESLDTKRVSEGIIKELAILGKQEGSINTYESELIENVFDMNDIEVYDIMVPKNKVIIVDISITYDKLVTTIRKTGFTRFPVGKAGEIIGVINAKDLFKFSGKEKSFSIDKILRKIEYAPESMKLSTLEQKLRRNRTHMAVIVNEHGDFTGVVTLEDIFEELLGEIEDEFDPEEDIKIKKLSLKKYLVDASYDIEELEEKFSLDLELAGDFTTVNGYLTNKLGRIPKKSESISFKGGVMKVVEGNNSKVLRVEIQLK